MRTARVLPASIALLLAMMMGAPAQADDYSTLFEQRYSSPEDVGVLGRFVSKAVEVGQYDQAISTLEQHLVKYPRDARAKYSLARANNSLAGFEWALDATVGIRSTWLETDQANFGTGWRDRQDWNPFIASNASLRIDLDSPLDDALIISGGFLAERRYEDINQGAGNPFPDFSDGGIYLHNRGYAAITLDKGIETTELDALRFQFGVFGNWRTYNPSVDDASLGTMLRFIIQPSVDTSAYVEGRYGSLAPSKNLAADHRFQAETGVTHRLSYEHSVGLAGRYIYEMRDDGVTVARQREAEVRYSGLLPQQPFDAVWTHQIGLGIGDFETRDASSLQFFVPTPSDGHYWKADWTHTFQIDGYNSVSLGYEFKRIDFTSGFFFFDNDYSTHSVSLSYTKSF